MAEDKAGSDQVLGAEIARLSAENAQLRDRLSVILPQIWFIAERHGLDEGLDETAGDVDEGRILYLLDQKMCQRDELRASINQAKMVLDFLYDTLPLRIEIHNPAMAMETWESIEGLIQAAQQSLRDAEPDVPANSTDLELSV